MPELEEGLWPWRKCPGYHPQYVVGTNRVRLRMVFEGVEVFEVDVWLCDSCHHTALAPVPDSEDRAQARARVEVSLGERWDNHAKPSMDALILAAGAPALPTWSEAQVRWPGETI